MPLPVSAEVNQQNGANDEAVRPVSFSIDNSPKYMFTVMVQTISANRPAVGHSRGKAPETIMRTFPMVIRFSMAFKKQSQREVARSNYKKRSVWMRKHGQTWPLLFLVKTPTPNFRVIEKTSPFKTKDQRI